MALQTSLTRSTEKFNHDQPLPTLKLLSLTDEQKKNVKSVAGFLGSFDPFHNGHDFAVKHLLSHFDVVLILVPENHFEKEIVPPKNSTIDQRIALLSQLFKDQSSKVGVGIAHQVLFLKLQKQLQQLFPSAKVTFGMGNDTFECLLASQEYYEGVGLPWTEEDQKQLDALKHEVVVFGRDPKGTLLVRQVVDGNTVDVRAESWQEVEKKESLKSSLRSSLEGRSLRTSKGESWPTDGEPPLGRSSDGNEDVILRRVSSDGTVPSASTFFLHCHQRGCSGSKSRGCDFLFERTCSSCCC
eukprot:TRINITY_DN1594_c0_g1_i4.p1 TRINITY_DN1594_c0_g1~~TRINITY_DN1594_c0_g1_i4.p1  ORF type:complete len:298 (-),score=92.22 TRINITY_DN1594_c0_g1_i4:109-1002(-)